MQLRKPGPLVVLLVCGLMLAWAGPVLGQGLSADSLNQATYRYYDRPIDPDRYLVRPGDRLDVTFVGTKLSVMKLSVNPEGKISDLNLGVFDLSGKTLSEARQILNKPLSRMYTAEAIDISVGQPYLVPITVTGAVYRPGLYLGYTSQFVSEVVEMAGGVTSDGSHRLIVFDGGPSRQYVDLDRATFVGDNSHNPSLYSGYHIHVPQRTNQTVHIVGEIRTSREIELLPGDNLDDLLALAGGVTRQADVNAVFVLGDSLRDIRTPDGLRGGDVVMVPPMADHTNTAAVQIFGAISLPGHYGFNDGGSLRDLIARAGGLINGANAERITVFRRSPDQIASSDPGIRYPISAMVGAGHETDFVLMAEDSVFVPRLAGFVKVTGRVRNPGLIPYRAGSDAGYYISAAGGFLADADRSNMKITDRVSRLTFPGGPDALVQDGDEVVVVVKDIRP